jgi:hypothetical protein
VKEDISTAIACGLKNAVMATSLHPNGMKTMKFSKEELLKRVREYVQYGTDSGVQMIVGITNPGWTEMDFIKEYAEVAIKAGAERIRISDPIIVQYVGHLPAQELKVIGKDWPCGFTIGLGWQIAGCIYRRRSELSANALGLGDRSQCIARRVLLSLLVFSIVIWDSIRQTLWPFKLIKYLAQE